MPKRAFIISIETYAEMQEGLSKTLSKTHEHAVNFRKSLLTDLGLAAGDILFCADDPRLPGRTSGAKRKEIQLELKKLKEIGKDQTEDLFFYFSGHGFSYVDVDGLPTADVLLAADYVERSVSGDACLKLDEIQKWLKFCIGAVTPTSDAVWPGHYYFIDACRNNVSERDIKVAPLGLAYDFSAKKKPPVFTLYSASTGMLAMTGSLFPDILIEGLNGKGHSKAPYQDAYAIMFDSLATYLEKRLQKELDRRSEGGGGVIKILTPPVEYTCALTVDNADPNDVFRVDIKNRHKELLKTFNFTGPTDSFKMAADNYFVQVSTSGTAVGMITPAGPVYADLYDDCALTYTKQPPRRLLRRWRRFSAPEPQATATLTVLAPNAAEVIVRSAGSEIAEGTGVLKSEVVPGTYVIETRDVRGMVVDRRELTVEPGSSPTIDMTKNKTSPLRDSLLDAIKGDHAQGAVDFSESLGPTPDQGLDLWLALVGAARILGGPDDFSKLGPLPLASFENVVPGAAPIYVVAGFEHPGSVFRTCLSADWRDRPAALPPHSGFPGLFELVEDLHEPGYRYLTLQVDNMASTTIGICSLPNRATLVTVSHDAAGDLLVQQFILPLRRLQHLLPEKAGMWLARDDYVLRDVSGPLRLVRRSVEAQRAFARWQELASVMTSSELNSLLYFKWFEPIVALLAAYEVARRGDSTPTLEVVVNNLRDHFSTLPDNDALGKLGELPWTPPASAPLILDGFLALNLMADRAELPPADALVFTGPWTMWRGLVRG